MTLPGAIALAARQIRVGAGTAGNPAGMNRSIRIAACSRVR
ncbi:hypothetical protein [Luteimonas sp. NJZ50]|nr:hypothetical protein [Lysobacter sedimenti]